ncbi:bifunctional aldolase/short-chain dehydrogenase [Endothiovibrio diazotrophicus]
MKSLWSDQEAKKYKGDLGKRVYTSRLLGRDPSLVLHGGGNTSVKIREKNLVGEMEDILYVKGSGWDLISIEKAGFAPVRIAHLLKLAKLPSLSDPQMVNELKGQTTLASAPSPSVETILHATLPFKYVDHTHADAVVTVTNTPGGEQRVREIWGDSVVVIPYVMPGFDLARLCAEKFEAEAHEGTVGMVLLNHGIFSFADDARESYERMIKLVDQAERYLRKQGAWKVSAPAPKRAKGSRMVAQAELRRAVSAAAGRPMLLSRDDSRPALAFAQHPKVSTIAQRGPATPDHIIRTKQLPMIGRDVKRYVTAYEKYFAKHAPDAREPKTMLDPAPRVILDPELGLVSVGKSAGECAIINDIYHHTMEIIQRAEQLGGYRALPANDLFDMEYWDLEQAKLRKGGKAPAFQGEVALVTGAASGIGKACVDSLLARGAAVVGLDLDKKIEGLYERGDYLGLVCDVTDTKGLQAALEATVARFGGLDMVVLNAGMFPGGKRIEELDDDLWRKVMAVNLDSNLALLREAHPLLSRAPNGGRVAIIGSKNVPAPGPGAAAYSASKAALNQLMRVAALEWGADNIRLNALHPDAVFDTGIWTDEVLQARAKHYGLTVEQYKTKNLLKTEITSHHVAELAAELCGPLFSKTTAAQIPIDGGNERVV